MGRVFDMPTILSLTPAESGLWASGPDGLFLIEEKGIRPVLQPQQQLYCSHACGKLVLVGGLPHGIAISPDDGANWHAAAIDAVKEPVVSLLAHPQFIENGVLLAGTAGAGVLRSEDRGWNWMTCNFGLANFTVLHFAWAPPIPVGRWPAWDVVFAATEEGVYRSPNGGLAWRRCSGAAGVFQTLLVSPSFHQDGVVFAGSDGSGLWLSHDGGRHFERVHSAPAQVNALAWLPDGWLLSDSEKLYHSSDGLNWTALTGSEPALTLLHTPGGIWLGGENGVKPYLLDDRIQAHS